MQPFSITVFSTFGNLFSRHGGGWRVCAARYDARHARRRVMICGGHVVFEEAGHGSQDDGGKGGSYV